MSQWYGYNLVKEEAVVDTGTSYSTGLTNKPNVDMVSELEYDEAFLYYVNDTSDTGTMIHLPSRNSYSFTIFEGEPYLKSVVDYEESESIFDMYDYDLTLCGNYS